MDNVTKNFALALQHIIDQNAAAADVATGDETGDEFFSKGIHCVLEDVKSLLNEMTTQDFDYPTDRPFIPAGFRLHAVIH